MYKSRRGFLSAILKAGVAAAVLPSAVTYGRKWVKSKELYLCTTTVEHIPIPSMNFLPSLLDFMQEHMERERIRMSEEIRRFQDDFIRNKVFPTGMGNTVRLIA